MQNYTECPFQSFMTFVERLYGSWADKTDSTVCIILVKFLSSKGHNSQGKNESHLSFMDIKFRKNLLSGFRGVALTKKKKVWLSDMSKLRKKQVWPLLTFTPDQNRVRLYLIRWWWVKKAISCPACAKNFKINKTQILKVSKYFYLNWYQTTVYMYFPLKISNSQQVMQVRFIVSKSTRNKYYISHHIIDL